MVRLAANLSFLFKEVAFLDRFRAAANHGFRAVEFMFPGANPNAGFAISAAAVRAELERAGVKQVLFNAPAGNWALGERGLGGLPAREDFWKASIRTALEYADELDCKRVHVMAGLLEEGASEEIFVDHLRWACVEASGTGVRFCIEPLNARDFPGYLVPDTTTALRILERVGNPWNKSCGLQLDLYHLQVTQGDLSENIRKLLPHVAHVQLANPPGRNEPGVGEVHFEPLLALLDELGYEGYVGLEYNPSKGTESSLKWAAAYGIVPPSAE